MLIVNFRGKEKASIPTGEASERYLSFLPLVVAPYPAVGGNEALPLSSCCCFFSRRENGRIRRIREARGLCVKKKEREKEERKGDGRDAADGEGRYLSLYRHRPPHSFLPSFPHT